LNVLQKLTPVSPVMLYVAVDVKIASYLYYIYYLYYITVLFLCSTVCHIVKRPWTAL